MNKARLREIDIEIQKELPFLEASRRVAAILDWYGLEGNVVDLTGTYLSACSQHWGECVALAWQVAMEDFQEDGTSEEEVRANADNCEYVIQEAARMVDSFGDEAVLKACGYDSPYDLPHVKDKSHHCAQ